MYNIGDKILVELEIETIVQSKRGYEYIGRIKEGDYLRTIRVNEDEIIKDMEKLK